MAITLPAALIQRKNAISGDGAFLTLVELDAGSETIYIVENTEAILWNGNQYQPFPIQIEPIKQNADGSFTSLTVRVSNVTRSIQPYIESNDGLVGCAVRFIVVNSACLDLSVTDLVCEFEIQGADITEQWVSFVLGQQNLLKKRYPLYNANPRWCGFRFKSARCGYTGALATCKHTLEDCRAHDNSKRFGGRPGLQSGGSKYL